MEWLHVAVIIAIFASLVAYSGMQFAVSGTRERYLYASMYRLLIIFVLLGFFVFLVVDCLNKSTAQVVWDLIIIVFWIYNLIRSSDEDDWFNRSWKKLKRWAKAYFAPRPRTRLATA